MSRTRIGLYLGWIVLAGCLYFFENGTGTRAVLLCSMLLPLIPAFWKAVFGPDHLEKKTEQERSARSASSCEADEPGDVRAYLSGDPVNRIHWKLSAKRDELLVRQRERETAEEESREAAPGTVFVPAARDGRKLMVLIAGLAVPVLLLLLFLVPEANLGARRLANRLFDASEAVNAYAYVRYAVSTEQPCGLAVLFLALTLLALLCAVIASGSRLAGLGVLAGIVAFQTFFGLALPGWANVLLFSLFILWMAARPLSLRTALFLPACILIGSLAVLWVWPGTDPGTEALSERARDRLSRMTVLDADGMRELPEGTEETRRAHTQSLKTGPGAARPEREYRLVLAEQEQISLPHWINYAKIILLLLLTAALVVLPFLPFLWFNARRKKGIEIRKGFRSENVSEAVQAIFQHTVAWLEATGNGAGNLPYRDWPEHLAASMSGEYATRFAPCAALFEEAAYSSHAMDETQREKALDLLGETQRTLLDRADWKQKFNLKYRECLWV